MSAQARATLDRELSELQENLQRVGGMVDQAIDRCLQALEQRDADLGRRVIEADAEVNRLRFEIEEACLRLIATQQPAASDLRAIMAAVSIVTDLERMGDHAAGIARIVQRMADEPLPEPLIELRRMADACRKMLNDALAAYRRADAEQARGVAAEDDVIDGLYDRFFRRLLTHMIEDPQTIRPAVLLLFAAHNLERIADRVTNIVERVIFVASGEFLELNPEPDDARLA
jgi:phosphate transport system protein